MCLDLSLHKLKKLSDPFFEGMIKDKSFNKKIVKNILSKVTDEMKDELIESCIVTLFVNDVTMGLKDLRTINIQRISDPWIVYLLCEIVRDDTSFGEKKIAIVLLPYSKKGYEATTFFRELLHTFSHVNKGTHIDLDSFESILSRSQKTTYAKGVKKSVTTTLTGLDNTKSFVPHKDTKHEIVSLERLSNYLNLEGKHRRVKCPVCDESYLITTSNLTKVLHVDDTKFIFKCTHEKNSKMIDKNFFELNISNYISGKEKSVDKSMFVLNNFKKLIELSRKRKKEENEPS